MAGRLKSLASGGWENVQGVCVCENAAGAHDPPRLLTTIRHGPGGDIPGVCENTADADHPPVS